MSYLYERNWHGVCCGSPGCGVTTCKHFYPHLHEVWGSSHAGGPWSCVQSKKECLKNPEGDNVICIEIKRLNKAKNDWKLDNDYNARMEDDLK